MVVIIEDAQKDEKSISYKNCVVVSDLNNNGNFILGKITNNCDVNLRWIMIELTAYDNQGKIVDVHEAIPCQSYDKGLKTKDSCTFKRLLDGDIEKYSVKVEEVKEG